ncbi:MAG TPA: hypothetical protein IAD07_09380 [Candidatus Fimivicinus intestinavium]|nr:hypothetical protein [Candidatus Fimivicinus intestinavium]
MKILSELYDRLLAEVPPPPPETGGILGARSGIVCAAYFDFGRTHSTRAVYEPDTARLNGQIADWEQSGIAFCGMFHSHLPGEDTLSGGDRRYITRILAQMPAQTQALFFPIILPGERLIPFRAAWTSTGVKIVSEPLERIYE